MESAPEAQHQMGSVRRGRPPKVRTHDPEQVTPAQSLALRIWEGQSNTLHRKERIDRITAGLLQHGLSMDGVELPDA